MTGRTACQYRDVVMRVRLNLKFRDQGATFVQLVPGGVALSVFHVENLPGIPHIFFRRAMTLQAPFHLERLRLRNHGHLIDPPVTRRAPHALCDVY